MATLGRTMLFMPTFLSARSREESTASSRSSSADSGERSQSASSTAARERTVPYFKPDSSSTAMAHRLHYSTVSLGLMRLSLITLHPSAPLQLLYCSSISPAFKSLHIHCCSTISPGLTWIFGRAAREWSRRRWDG